MTEKRYSYSKSPITGLYVICDEKLRETFSGIDDEYNCSRIVRKLNILTDENEQLKNRVDELEDDNMKYTLSTDKLEDYSKRFIPTKGIGTVRDCKTNRYYDLYNEDNFTGILELLNLLDYKNEELKQKISELECLLELDKLHKEVEEGKMDKFVELKLND